MSISQTDITLFTQRIEQALNAASSAKDVVMRIYNSEQCLVYMYPHMDPNVVYSHRFTTGSQELLKRFIEECRKPGSGLIVCDVKNSKTKSPHIRIRINPEGWFNKYSKPIDVWRRAANKIISTPYQPSLPPVQPPQRAVYYRYDPTIVSPPVEEEKQNTNAVTDETNKGEKRKMKDFSISNLKDALIDKITRLDKKTVSILALIVLVLLILTRYKDIKDILKGVKDKVTTSENFKAMMSDANGVLDNLKTLVGVKKKEGK